MSPLCRFFSFGSLLFCVTLASAQIPSTRPVIAPPARNLITRPIDESQRTILRGNRHPLARSEFDRGAAPASLPMTRMLLVLKRSDEQESALKTFLADQQTRGSAHYHQWLTPEDFGKSFGPSDSDMEKIKAWLNASGFQVTAIANGRTAIEFSGTADQVRQAFATPIHRYDVNGRQHWANAAEPSIPSALTPVVDGILTLHNFPRHSQAVIHGQPLKMTQGSPSSYFTFSAGQNTFYGLGPTDFANIYDILPLWNEGIDGTGQTIAIVGETNINVSDVDAFRNLFSLPKNTPNVILNGPDPGIVGDETEALLDVSWSGAVAKNATIDFVVSAGTETSLGVDLSALYIVDNNLASVMSESYGICESALGNTGNAFYNALWQQAAAQGITVVVSSGDAGSAGCDDFNAQSTARTGLAVSGFASTPYNVSVGGTDFDQSPATFPTYWNATNDSATLSSAKSYIPETTWNQSCAADGVDGCGSDATNLNLLAGSGGPSSCSTLTSESQCLAGYAKPNWQTGNGIPQDGVRDLPDVSLFASAGYNGTFYIVCEADFSPVGPAPGWNEPCSLTNLNFVGLGGTSASAPAFAGIMALVNQKTGSRQGNANYILYNLAAKAGATCDSSQAANAANSCIFHDVTKGNNAVPCFASTPNCGASPSGGTGVLVDPNSPTPAWTATPGYDLATGLGTVDGYNLVNAWAGAAMAQTTTTLTNITQTTLVHGQPVSFTATVAATGGTGTPTGSVALIASPTEQSIGIVSFTLANGTGSGSTALLPGGSYNVTAHYAGDGIFAASDSAPIQVTVDKEGSLISASLAAYDFVHGGFQYTSTVPYGAVALLRANVTGANGTSCAPGPQQTGIACPTGSVSFTSVGQPIDAGNYALNSLGYVEDQGFAQHLSALGSYSVAAQYSGDASYSASEMSLDATVTQAPTFIYYLQVPDLTPDYTGLNYTAYSGQAFHVAASAFTQSVLNAPTGTVSIQQNGASPAGTVVTSPWNGSYGGGFTNVNFAYLASTLSETIDTPGTYTYTAAYAGDAHYLGSQSAFPVRVTVLDTTFKIAGTIPNVTITAGSSATATLGLAVINNFAGQVAVTCGLPTSMSEAHCSASSLYIAGSTSAASTLTIATTAPHQIAANSRPPLARGFVALASMIMIAFGAKRRRCFLAVLMLISLSSLVACGGGGGSTGSVGGGNLDQGTPRGTYTVNVSAVSNNITRTASFTVTVQ
ncbi:MAG TPA: protease pro-enzyme activation domain-containing protein [Terracidiphilus sp.]|nr:protease pro-enzyme activation domain-containing protein [Terracidiphilus sp.]